MTTASNDQTIQLSDEYRWSKLQLRRFEYCIVEVFELLRKSGIEPILLKGWAINQFYPGNRPRTFSDIDLAVSANDYRKTEELILGFEKHVSIDLHNEFRHLDILPWGELFARSQLKKLDNAEIRILSPEDHLRVLCTHWLNDGGEYRERLWDIYYAIENRPKNFDWCVCLDSVSKTRKQWVMVTIFAAHKYLGLDISNLPFASEIKTLPKWMERCLEREWESTIRLLPMQTVLNDPKKVWQQIRKRFPPNPIQATIENEGDFDDSSRFVYQIRSILKRTIPSVERLVPVLLTNLKK